MRAGVLLPACLFALSMTLTAEETVLREAPVPNRLLKQGTARLIRLDDSFGVRIDLHTRHLNRVVSKVVESETENWPEHPGSVKYRKALKDLASTVLENQSGKASFSIHWLVSSDGSGTVRLGNELYRRELDDLPADYLRKNLILILRDRFTLSNAEAETLLQPHENAAENAAGRESSPPGLPAQDAPPPNT